MSLFHPDCDGFATVTSFVGGALAVLTALSMSEPGPVFAPSDRSRGAEARRHRREAGVGQGQRPRLRRGRCPFSADRDSGWYWPAPLTRLVVNESRLELARIMPTGPAGWAAAGAAAWNGWRPVSRRRSHAPGHRLVAVGCDRGCHRRLRSASTMAAASAARPRGVTATVIRPSHPGSSTPIVVTPPAPTVRRSRAPGICPALRRPARSRRRSADGVSDDRIGKGGPCPELGGRHRSRHRRSTAHRPVLLPPRGPPGPAGGHAGQRRAGLRRA